MDKYHVIEMVGVGSFGKVYKGRRKYTGQLVALKFILKQGKAKKDLEALRQEINILKALQHENIIRMLDSFETNTDICVVTEFAQGELFEVLQGDHNTLSEPTIKSIAQQLIQALCYLHKHRIIHRDLKPQNILITSGGRVKLCDFGFARAMSEHTVMVNSIKGTPLYMAPELVQEQPYTYAVDIWSTGVILYELYTGQPPFYTQSIYTLIRNIVRDDVKYPSSMSREFKSFLQGLLTKNIKHRLGWPKLLDHPFLKDYPKEKSSPLQKERSPSLLRKGTPEPFNSVAAETLTPRRISEAGHYQSSKPVAPKSRLREGDKNVVPISNGGPSRAQSPVTPVAKLQQKAHVGIPMGTPRGTSPRGMLADSPSEKGLSRLGQCAEEGAKLGKKGSSRQFAGPEVPAVQSPNPQPSPLGRLKPLPDETLAKTDKTLLQPQPQVMKRLRSEGVATRRGSSSGSGSIARGVCSAAARVHRQDFDEAPEAISNSSPQATPEHYSLPRDPHPPTSANQATGGTREDKSGAHPCSNGRSPSTPRQIKQPSSGRLHHNGTMRAKTPGAGPAAEAQQAGRVLQEHLPNNAFDQPLTSDRPKSQAQAEPQSGTALAHKLTVMEQRVSCRSGAEAVLGNPEVELVHVTLKRPARGSDYTHWACSLELRKASRIAAKLLEFCGDGQTTKGLQRGLIAAAYAVLPIQPETAAMVADSLCQAEETFHGACGQFVGFEGTSALYSDMLSHRGSHWEACTSGCRGLAGLFKRAHQLLDGSIHSCHVTSSQAFSAIKMGTRGAAVVPRLFNCLEAAVAANHAGDGAQEAFAMALDALMGLAIGKVEGSMGPLCRDVADAGSGLQDSGQEGEPQQGAARTTSLFEAVQQHIAETLLGCPSILDAFARLVWDRHALSVQVTSLLLVCCRASGEVGLAAALADLPQALLSASEGKVGPLAVMLYQTIVQTLVHASPSSDREAAVTAILPADSIEESFAALVSLMQASASDLVMLNSAQAAMSSLAALASKAGLPMDEIQSWHHPIVLQSICAMLDPGINPTFQGLLDGPIGLLSTVWQLTPAADRDSGRLPAAVDIAMDMVAAPKGLRDARLEGLSPAGCQSLLELLRQVIVDEEAGYRLLSTPGSIKLCVELLEPGNNALANPPPRHLHDSNRTFSLVCEILTRLLEIRDLPEADIATLVEVMLDGQVVKHITQGLRGHDLPQHAAIYLLDHLCHLREDLAIEQFISAGGLQEATLARVLDKRNGGRALASALQLLGSITRGSENDGAALVSASICPLLKPLLVHKDPAVRCGGIGLVGCLCRQNEVLHIPLRDAKVVPLIVRSCDDPDSHVRKAACVAIGNLAFHSDKLYESLGESIPALVQLLQDEQSSVQSSAATALGNLGKHGDLLLADLAESGALEGLLDLVHMPASPSSPPRCQAQRKAVAALSILCNHSRICAVLDGLGIRDVLGQQKSSSDSELRKQSLKLLEKVRQKVELFGGLI